MRWQLATGFFSLLVLTFSVRPAFGAERIYLSYGILERSLAVNSLETFANTGKVDGDLAVYVRRVSPTQLAQLRQALQRPIPLNVVNVSQFLYTPIGERLLDRLGSVIQTDARQSGFYGIRAALILAAADPQGFTPLSVLRQFPTHGIHIDLAESLAIVGSLQMLVSQTRSGSQSDSRSSQAGSDSDDDLHIVALR